MARKCAGRPTNPCHENPHTKYTTAAVAITMSEAIMECAALRERPSPVLMSESPAPARGTSRIKTRQSTVNVSENAGTGREVTLYPLAPADGSGRPEPPPAPLPQRRPAQSRCAAEPTPAAPLQREPARLPPAATRNPRASWKELLLARVNRLGLRL